MLPLRTSGRFLTILLSLVLIAPVGMATYGVYGTFVEDTATDTTHRTAVDADADFAWRDLDTDCIVDNTERIYLDMDNSATVTVGDFQFNVGSPSVGAANTIVGAGHAELTQTLTDTADTVTLDGCAGSDALDTLVLAKTITSGTRSATAGFSFTGTSYVLDLDKNGYVSDADFRVGGTSPGAFVGASGADRDVAALDTTQITANTDCIYLSANAVVDASDTRIGRCGDYLDGSAPSCTGVLDTDCGWILFTLASAAVGSGEYYFDEGSLTVGAGDRRLSPVTGTLSEGTTPSCPTDTDCATVLVAAPTVRFARKTLEPATAVGNLFRVADTNDDGAVNDFIGIDASNDGVLGPNEPRMTAHGSFQAGSIIAAADLDNELELLEATSAAITYEGTTTAFTKVILDLDGDNAFDPEDVALQTFSSCSAGSVRRSSTVCNVAVSTPTSLAIVYTAAAGARLAYRESGGGAGFGTGDTLYLSLEGTDTVVDSDDLRLGTYNSGAPGLAVGGGVTGEANGNLVTLAAPPKIAVIDMDASGAISPGDIPILDVDGNLLLSPGDVTFGTATGLTFAAIAPPGTTYAVHGLSAAVTAAVKYIDNDGSSTPSLNDPVYLHITAPVDSKFRLSASATGGAAGLPASTESAALFTSLVTTGLCAQPFAYQEVGGTGFSNDDDVYIDMNTCGSVSVGDIFLKKSGKQPGTKVGSSDTQGQTLVGVTPSIRFFDADFTGGLSNGDHLYIENDAGDIVSPFDFRLSGSNGATTLGSTTPPPPPPPPPPTSTTSTSSQPTSSTSSSSTTATTTTSSTTSTTGSNDAATLAGMNQALAASLQVKREAKANVLTWDEQTNALGYQVFSSDSPFVLIATLPSDARSHTDTEGGKSTKYLVTACLATCTLTADQVNDGDVPGYDDTPKGEGVQDKKGFIPAVGPIPVVLAVLAAALVLARRRLK